MIDVTDNLKGSNEAQMQIKRLYVKKSVFVAPNVPHVFKMTDWKPDIEVTIDADSSHLGNNAYEVILPATVIAKSADTVIYRVDVIQAGIFELTNFPQEQLEYALGAYCPTVLFPYSRQIVSEAIINGGFPVMHLAPINFEVAYRQRLKSKPKEETEKTH